MDFTQISAALITVIASISVATVAIINAIGNNKKVLLEATQAQTRDLTIKSEQIHNLVNGRASAAESKLVNLESQVKSLNEIIRSLQDKRVEEAKA